MPVVLCGCVFCWGEGDVPESLRRIEKFLNTQIEFHELDLLDKPGLEKIFKMVKMNIHCFIFSWLNLLISELLWLNIQQRPLVANWVNCFLSALCFKHSFYAVMHFAGLKAVGESVEQPLRYYRVNLTGTINLLEVRKVHGLFLWTDHFNAWSVCMNLIPEMQV